MPSANVARIEHVIFACAQHRAVVVEFLIEPGKGNAATCIDGMRVRVVSAGHVDGCEAGSVVQRGLIKAILIAPNYGWCFPPRFRPMPS